ncbi:MAG: alpha/beta hydrolase [Desulfomonilia bacterium]|jgi:pimeloyl-ACP methyl ester carboxylesterase
MRHRIMRISIVPAALIILSCLAGCSWLGVVSVPAEEMRARYLKPEDKFFAYRGMEIRYRDEGQGPAVVLIHGVCSSLETWDAWAQGLKQRYRVVRMDLPGFGLTGPAPDKSFYDRQSSIETLDTLVDHLGLESFFLVGNSLGGFISWNYSLKHPDKVRKMILIDPVGFNDRHPGLITFAGNPLVRPVARRMMPRFLVDKGTTGVYGDKSKVTRELKDRYFDFAMSDGNKASYVDVFVQVKQWTKSGTLAEGIPEITVPTLVMWGTKDEWISYSNMSSWQQALPGARYLSYEGAGHVPMEEIPEETLKDALEFLQ